MTRIADTLQRLRDQGRSALIPYVTAGDPEPGATVAIMHAMVEAGADFIELGMPFSDPIADGPTIQKAHERALKHRVSVHDVLDMVREFRRRDSDTPVVLMGYLNPIEIMGVDVFASGAADAGVDGVLVVDVPPEESGELVAAVKSRNMDVVLLVTPTTADERVRKIAAASSGYLYYVSVKGVTGSGSLDVDAVRSRVEAVRGLADLPVGVGFGITTPEAARDVGRFADGVIVGSAVIRLLESKADDQPAMLDAVRELLSGMRQAMDAG